MVEQIYPLLILIGTTIGAVLLYLWHQSHSASNINLALIRLNEQHQFDTPVFLREAWPLLSQAGLKGIVWRLDWFGVPIEGQSGKLDGKSKPLRKEIRVAEMHLVITFHQTRQGERRYFDEALIETFLLLLRTDMWIKSGATDATFAQMSKLTLFLQHDMKNIAQFIQLMADQLASVPEGKEHQVLDYLRTATPLIRDRADHIVRTLTAGQPHDEPLRTLHLDQELQQICNLHRLECTISGTAQVRLPINTLESAFDNILKNYGDISHGGMEGKPSLKIEIADQHNVIQITIAATNMPVVTHIERLFEPFWSDNPQGLGIGLYQAKQVLEACQGTIQADQTDTGQLRFQVQVPKSPAPQ